MKLIVCTDDRGGMMFNKRRTTFDVVVIADILREGIGGKLLVAPYTEKLFIKASSLDGYTPVSGAAYQVSDDPVGDAEKGDTVFLEDRSAKENLHKIDKIIIYNWNYSYPKDFSFDIDPRAEGFVLSEQIDFPGYNHDLITKSTFIRKK